jgi:5-dehydro-2-deoxygluconokinase
MRVFAFDHRMQLEEMEGATTEKIGAFKELCLKLRLQVADGRPGYGILCDNRLGRDALHKAAGTGSGSGGRWNGPARAPDAGAGAWPRFRRPVRNGRWSMWSRSCASATPTTMPRCARPQEDTVTPPVPRLPPQPAGIAAGDHPVEGRAGDDQTNAQLIQRFYDLGVYPDWWKLEPMQRPKPPGPTPVAAITANDPMCAASWCWGWMPGRGELAASFRLRRGAAGQRLCRGPDDLWRRCARTGWRAS